MHFNITPATIQPMNILHCHTLKHTSTTSPTTHHATNLLTPPPPDDDNTTGNWRGCVPQ